jgi:phosphoserine phosphatase
LTPSEIEIHRWTIQEFKNRVLEAKPKVAVFDCDGTLWRADSGYGFMAWSLEQGLVSRSTSDWIDNRHRSYRAGEVSELEICGEMVRIYEGLRDQELRTAAAQYVDEFVRPHIFTDMADIVATLKDMGTELWAVSSTNRWVIAEGVREFGITEDKILAASVRVKDGVITSEILDVPTGDGKAVSLRRVGHDSPDAVFGNSIHDMAMLEMAENPFPVNPSPSLLEAATKKGWGYFRPAAAEEDYIFVHGE